MDDVMGDVVAEIRARSVTMTADGEKVRVQVGIPYEVNASHLSCIYVDTDFETARRMVEGDVYMMLVVPDGGSDD